MPENPIPSWNMQQVFVARIVYDVTKVVICTVFSTRPELCMIETISETTAWPNTHFPPPFIDKQRRGKRRGELIQPLAMYQLLPTRVTVIIILSLCYYWTKLSIVVGGNKIIFQYFVFFVHVRLKLKYNNATSDHFESRTRVYEERRWSSIPVIPAQRQQRPHGESAH